MLATRLSTLGKISLTSFVTTFSNQSVRPLGRTNIVTKVQRYATETRSTLRRQVKSGRLKAMAMAPAGNSAFNIGRGAVAGASLVGLGALCYYGLGMSSQAGAIDKTVFWSDEIKHRIRATYMYFGGSIAVTALSAVAATRNPAIMRMAMNNSWMAIGASFAAMIGTGMVCRAIPYQEGFGSKQMAWMVHAGVMGVLVAPLTLLGGPIMIRAAWYTAGLIGALSTLAMCAPSEKFLTMGGPLAIGFGVVFASSLGSMFLSPATALGAGLYSISIYGGLVLFSMFLLYDTQKVIKMAEIHSPYSERQYDPVNASMGIYMDTLNIFIRIAMILSGGGSRRK